MNPLISAPVPGGEPQRPVSAFADADICREVGLALPQGASRPVFEDDAWDFTHVIALPVQMPLAKRRFDFAVIRECQIAA